MREIKTKLTKTIRKLISQFEPGSDPVSNDDDSVALLVGLGNPGAKYVHTRHNVGAIWVQRLADRFGIRCRNSTRFTGLAGQGLMLDREVRVLIPTTYMNRSGRAVAAIMDYFRIPEHRVLVAHDDVAFEPGVSKLKMGGGTNGHNGLIDIIRCLGNRDGFARLRIGVGHPGNANSMTNYLTQRRIPDAEQEAIERSAHWEDELLKLVLAGEWQLAMTRYQPGRPSAVRPDSS